MRKRTEKDVRDEKLVSVLADIPYAPQGDDALAMTEAQKLAWLEFADRDHETRVEGILFSIASTLEGMDQRLTMMEQTMSQSQQEPIETAFGLCGKPCDGGCEGSDHRASPCRRPLGHDNNTTGALRWHHCGGGPGQQEESE